MALLMDLAVLFAGLNSVLLAGLLYLYGRIARRTRAIFAIGLLTFALLVLLHNVMTVYTYLALAPLFGEGVLPYLFATTALEFGGLLVLLRITF